MPCRIAFVIFPGLQQLDVAGPLAAFEIAERAAQAERGARSRYAWRFVAAEAGPITSTSGLVFAAEALPPPREVDLVLVSGGDGVDAACGNAALVAWLRRCARDERRRIASVCSGSLLLAAAGLLDGRSATTHWSRTRESRDRHPQVDWQADRIYVRDGRFWTSAGISAGIDLALALITADHGEPLARRVAQYLVVYHRRPGGQSQFSSLLELSPSDGRFAPLLHAVRSTLAERHSVEDLAARACMSPRQFARAFRAETGSTPAKAVERLRVEAARAALQSGSASVQQVVRDCGFGQPERMRRAFQRLLGHPPAAVKRLARAPAITS